FKYITIIINYLMKIKYYIPTIGLTVKELAERFIKRIYNIYNLSNSIVFNRST
ncbi:hypothetical protein NEUTE2DRAFT_62164, partial [Neurospora tetrasperma FGSC 2509]